MPSSEEGGLFFSSGAVHAAAVTATATAVAATVAAPADAVGAAHVVDSIRSAVRRSMFVWTGSVAHVVYFS